MRFERVYLMKTTIQVNPKYEDISSFVYALSEQYDKDGEVIYNGRNQVKRFFLNEDQPVIVKRYKKPNFIQRVAYSFFKPNKAERAFEYAIRLKSLGIDTPLPLACITTWHGALVYQYYFISSEDNRPSCLDLMDKNLSYREGLVEALANFFVKMHQAGFLHGDTNLTNFLYSYSPQNNLFSLATIDLNRSTFVANPSKKECLLNFVRLSHNREILQLVVGAYARLRGWDVKESIDFVVEHVGRFERKKARSYRLKGRPLEEWMK